MTSASNGLSLRLDQPLWRFSSPDETAEAEKVGVDSWEECLLLLQDNLEDIGVRKERCPALAAVLYSCYLHTQSLLLAGPRGKAVADAFSLALCGKPAARLECCGPFDPAGLDAAADAESEVISVFTPFAPGWIEPLAQLAEDQKKILFLILPIAEDLKVEPKGLFSYVLPVSTETFMRRGSQGNPSVAEFSEFWHPTPQYRKLKYGRLFRQMCASPFVLGLFQQIISAAEEWLESDELKEESEFLYGLLPFAYVAGQTEKMSDVLARSHLDPSLKSLLKHLSDEAFSD